MLDIPPERIVQKIPRARPGKMLLVDTVQRRDHRRTKSCKRAHTRTDSPTANGWISNLVELNGPARCPTTRFRTLQQTARDRLYKGFRLHLRGSEGRPSFPWRATGSEAYGLHGRRISPLAVLVGKASAAVQLFQAAVCPGDQPADRRHPGKNRHRYDRYTLGSDGNLLQEQAGKLRGAADRTTRSCQ